MVFGRFPHLGVVEINGDGAFKFASSVATLMQQQALINVTPKILQREH